MRLLSWLVTQSCCAVASSLPYIAEYEKHTSLGSFDAAQRSRNQHTPIPHVQSDEGGFFTMPLFIVIGTQKGGTTNLRKHLLSHPLLTGQRWEVHHFDRHGGDIHPQMTDEARAAALEAYSDKLVYGVSGHPNRNNVTALRDGKAFLMDTSPSYMFNHATPRRVKELLPHVRAVAVLRDPTDRFFSQLGMEYCRQRRNVIKVQYPRPGGATSYVARADTAYLPYRDECNAVGADLAVLSQCYVNATSIFGPLFRGLYAEQLERWFTVLGRDQVMVVSSNDLFGDFKGTLAKVTQFAGLPPHDYVYNPKSQLFDPDCPRGALSAYEQVKVKYRKFGDDKVLRKWYRPHNERLFALLGRDLGWNDVLAQR